MDAWTWFEWLMGSLVAATFLWIGLMVLIEGDQRARITRMLATAMIALALFNYGALALWVAPGWSAIQARAMWWLIAITSVSWYAVAIYHTRACFPRRWKWLWRAFLCFSFWAGIQAFWSSARPNLFLATSSSLTEGITNARSEWLAFFSILPAQAALWAALAVYIRARRGRHWHGLKTWFIPATVCAIIGLLLVTLPLIHGLHRIAWHFIDRRVSVWLGQLVLLGCAGFQLGAITTNRKLLGRSISTRDLYVRWVGLMGCLVIALAILNWDTDPTPQGDLFVLVIAAPLALAVFDWRTHRIYKRSIAESLRFVQAAVSNWPTLDLQGCRSKAQQLLDTLAAELRADACYLRLQASSSEEPFIIHSGPLRLRPCPAAPRNTDSCLIEVNGYLLGLIVLRGPRGIAYSDLELDLARSCAYGISALYLSSRQTHGLETLVVRRERERETQYQRLQRVLHDRVGSNLDVILKAAHFLERDDDEWGRDIREAALESIIQIRNLLREELSDLYPVALLREGLIAALHTDILPRYQTQRHEAVSLALDVDGMDDAMLNELLNDDLKRTLYGALDEAIRNAAKYASGNTGRLVLVQVRLRHDQNGFSAEVQDNGIGFIPELATSEGDGMGLRYHQAALRMAGGMMTVESHSGGGTTVRLNVPGTGLCEPHQEHARLSTARSGLEWRSLILATEKHRSGRLLFNDDLSDLTRTPAVIELQARRRIVDERQAQAFAAIDRERQVIFERYVHDYLFKDLIDQQRLIRYIGTGMTDVGYEGVGVMLARQHVRNVIRLLREYPNYYLALSGHPFDANFAIKPGYAILWERRAEDGEGKLDGIGIIKGIRVNDPSIVTEYTRRFEVAWEKVPPLFREKPSVIAWLEARLAEADVGLLDILPERFGDTPQDVRYIGDY